MTGNDQAETKTQHLDQSLPYEWRVVNFLGKPVVLWDEPESRVRAYSVTTVTHNHRTLAKADAALVNGRLVRPDYNDELRCVEYHHSFGGLMDRASVAEWSDAPMVRLNELPGEAPEAMLHE